MPFETKAAFTVLGASASRSGFFPKIGVPHFGVLIIRILFRVPKKGPTTTHMKSALRPLLGIPGLLRVSLLHRRIDARIAELREARPELGRQP